MKRFAIALILLIGGCGQSAEESQANLRKGDEFFDRKEYEVAEYYYEKVPQESPLYPQASKKLEEIAAIKKQWVEKVVPPSELAKILIIDHTYQMDNITHVPSHRLSLVNNTSRILDYITVEFTYFDKSGVQVGQLTTEAHTPMFQNTQDVFKGIEPGVLTKEFATSQAKIVGARFQ